MKLELKHLAPYLPYSIKLIVSSVDGSDYELLTGLISQNGVNIAQISNTDYYLDDADENDFAIAPILRPLSDLTKEIEVNGEKFVPIEKIYDLMGWEKDELKDLIDRGDIIGIYSDIDLIPYSHALKLLEWHFDVFGLIEKYLAIDFNTLNN